MKYSEVDGRNPGIVHMDKLVPVQGRYDGSWVSSLPPKRELGIEDDHLKGVKRTLS